MCGPCREKLIEKGYLTGKADHIYGKRTRAAVRAFQEDNGLRVDGIVGPETPCFCSWIDARAAQQIRNA